MPSPPKNQVPAARDEVYDLVGIGFGPSNLALAAAIEEEAETLFGQRLRCRFFERKPEFAWHPDMLIEGASIQLTFLKDLVTLRNPQSRFSFLTYLKARDRLDRFVNLRKFYPTRREFNDYYSWVAEQLAGYVRYGTEVVSAARVDNDGGPIELVRVRTRDLATHRTGEFLTRNLVVATGGVPAIPDRIDLRASRRAFHSQDFLSRIHRDFPDTGRPYRFAVVGSGQSAAEIFHYVYSHYPRADVTAAIRRFAYKPADSSHFVNEIFFPRMEDFLFDLPAEKRRSILEAHRDTNYSCVDLELIEAIYQDLYEAEVAGENRFRIRSFIELRGIEERESEMILEFHDVIGERTEYLEVDGAILATGFVRPGIPPSIGDLSAHLSFDSKGRFKIDRHYRILNEPGFEPRIFLQGFCEDTHGLSDTLLSTLPTRVLGILKQLRLAPADDENNIETVENLGACYADSQARQ